MHFLTVIAVPHDALPAHAITNYYGLIDNCMAVIDLDLSVISCIVLIHVRSIVPGMHEVQLASYPGREGWVRG